MHCKLGENEHLHSFVRTGEEGTRTHNFSPMNPLFRVMQCDEPKTKALEVGPAVSALSCVGVSHRHKSAAHHGHRVFLCRVRARLFLQGAGRVPEFIEVEVCWPRGRERVATKEPSTWELPSWSSSGANTYSMLPDFLKQPLHPASVSPWEI